MILSMLLQTSVQQIPVEGLSFGISTVLSLIFGSGGALAVWFTFKNRVDLANQKIEDLVEDNRNAHERISNVKKDLEKHKELTNEFKIEIKNMELRIVEKINEALQRVTGNGNS